MTPPQKRKKLKNQNFQKNEENCLAIILRHFGGILGVKWIFRGCRSQNMRKWISVGPPPLLNEFFRIGLKNVLSKFAIKYHPSPVCEHFYVNFLFCIVIFVLLSLDVV